MHRVVALLPVHRAIIQGMATRAWDRSGGLAVAFIKRPRMAAGTGM